MSGAARFPFLPRPGGNGPLDQLPFLPLKIAHGNVSLDLIGIIDSGASFSVLPYDVGLRFGVSWSNLPSPLSLGGAYGRSPAKMINVKATVPPFPPIPIFFAWVKSNHSPVLLGQVDFLFHFDVYLCRRHSYFEIQPATP
ncbi:MAG TPA: hypothetical protein VN641_09805 [Urbifossiella sp.]|nr:hypothetical protein [Urbifossiella sp.]